MKKPWRSPTGPLSQARASLEELGSTIDVVTLAFWTGPLELLAGDAVAAEREVGHACDVLEAAGEKGWLSTMATLLAEASYARLDEAEAAVARSRNAATSDDYSAQGLWRAAEGKILAARGMLDEADRVAREAAAFMERTDELDNWANVRASLAEVLRLAGRTKDAIPVLESALTLYEQKGNEVMTGRTRALIEELSTAASPGS